MMVLLLLLALLTLHLVSPLPIEPTEAYKQRREVFLRDSAASTTSLSSQTARILLGIPIAPEPLFRALDEIYRRDDCSDFTINVILRLLYLDKTRNVLTKIQRSESKRAVLNFKYWFDYPGNTNTIFWTENHMILFHAAELLAGNLYPAEKFISGNTGEQHAGHAKKYIKEWLKFRGRLGFSEWHSNVYVNELMAALLNLSDFCGDLEISVRTSALTDLLFFGFANNYFRGIYACPHARSNDKKILGTSPDSTNEAAWLGLGISSHSQWGNMAANFMATGTYYVPPVLEAIARNATLGLEHRERNSISVDEGPRYGVGYENITDMMYWLSITALLAPKVITSTTELLWNLDLASNFLGVPSRLIAVVTYALSFLHFSYPSGYSAKIKDFTQGISLETGNIYTYRTPFYQISAAQDHQKGQCGVQEHIWQASLSEKAFVSACSPQPLKGMVFAGGWKPRATFHKNVGVIQYDRERQLWDLEALLWAFMSYPYMHISFPKKVFDEVIQEGNWVFGRKDQGYLALYSKEALHWENSYELRTDKKKNLVIVEMGSSAESGSFLDFIHGISKAKVSAQELGLGYKVEYVSPSQGKIEVGWTGDMLVQGTKVDIGPYLRFDNKYCRQEFGSERSSIGLDGERLELDFVGPRREYYRN